MYANIKPSEQLMAKVKKRMKEEEKPKRKKRFYSNSMVAVQFNGKTPINIVKKPDTASDIGNIDTEDGEATTEAVIPDWYKPGNLNVLSFLRNKQASCRQRAKVI